MSESWKHGSSTRWRTFRALILKRDRYRCRVGLPVCTGVAALVGGHVDHIIPLSVGGAKYDPANARAACAPCNLSRGKGDRAGSDPDPVPVSRW